MLRRLLIPLLLTTAAIANAAQPPAPRDVDLTASDGTKLKATYFAAAKPGPAIILLHQCNRDRTMWNDLAAKLVAAGLNVLTLDFRGFGESGGVPVAKATAQQANEQFQKFPTDVETAYEYLVAQSGVKKIIGAAGASCGVNQSALLASRHPEVKSIVLLSGPANPDARRYLKQSDVVVLGAGAEDDAFPGSLEQTEWLVSLSGNPGSRFIHYKNGGHGIEMFAPHPELANVITDWFTTTLIKTPGHAPAERTTSARPFSILAQIDEPGGAAKVAEKLKANPNSVTLQEAAVNQIGYEHLQAGDNDGAIEIFKLNVSAFPSSPNTYDSLADAYVAAGQNDLAVRNAKTALHLLESDTTDPEARREAIRQSAEQKLKQVKEGN